MSDFVHVICENYVPTSFGIIGEHGFSALINANGNSVIFDTGQGIGFMNNARLMGINPAEAQSVALSHGHKDHTGALLDYIRAVGKKSVIAHPGVFDARIAKSKIGDREIKLPVGISWQRADLEAAGAEFRLTAEPLEISPGIWFSGEIPIRNDFEIGDANLFVGSGDDLKNDPFIDDASLFIETPNGISIVAGCAHRGIVNTMDRAREVIGDKPFYAVIGGLHLMNADDGRIEKTVAAFKKYDVKLVSTGHCTGLPAAFKIAGALGGAYQFMWAGKRFEI